MHLDPYQNGDSYVSPLPGQLMNENSSFNPQTDSANVLTSLMPPNSDHVMIRLGDYCYAICHTQLITWEYVQTEQL